METHRDNNGHPYHSIRIPHDAPFKLGISPGKGWGAFATQKITKGDVILKEKPLFVIRKPHWMIEERDVLSAYYGLTREEKCKFLSVRDNATGIFSTMESAFAENSFAIPAQPGMAHGFFLLHSRFNHSCLPNCKIPDQVQPDDCMISYATCDIEAGAEILFCYENNFSCRTRNERHRILRFECTCPACERSSPFRKHSDMRRLLMRGLYYLTTGRDIDGSVHSFTASPLINDSELKKNAETQNITLSSRFVYNMLSMALLEQEGLLDAFLEAHMAQGLILVLQAFGTESNRTMADQTVLQEGWVQRFFTASCMWGRRDAEDAAFAQQLRLPFGADSG